MLFCDMLLLIWICVLFVKCWLLPGSWQNRTSGSCKELSISIHFLFSTVLQLLLKCHLFYFWCTVTNCLQERYCKWFVILCKFTIGWYQIIVPFLGCVFVLGAVPNHFGKWPLLSALVKGFVIPSPRVGEGKCSICFSKHESPPWN